MVQHTKTSIHLKSDFGRRMIAFCPLPQREYISSQNSNNNKSCSHENPSLESSLGDLEVEGSAATHQLSVSTPEFSNELDLFLDSEVESLIEEEEIDCIDDGSLNNSISYEDVFLYHTYENNPEFDEESFIEEVIDPKANVTLMKTYIEKSAELDDLKTIVKDDWFRKEYQIDENLNDVLKPERFDDF